MRPCALMISFSHLYLALIVVCLSLWAFASVSGEDKDGYIEPVVSYLPFPQQSRLVAFFSFEKEEFEVKLWLNHTYS